ncbi:hypothetical protein SEUCBS139899_010393 [Sporothrix eucalyptigena]|uniref:DNA damage-binding protein CMR1 n=1 Tax=Sporothrix eucalyptigena TaxID=1812306 RepID=A0ABP0D3D3_9PEZI
MAVSTDAPGLTAWERRRAENAKANNEILNNISKTSAKVFAAASKPAAQTKKKPARRVKSEPVQRESPMPTRRSARVAGIEADPETLKRKLDGTDGVLEYGIGESARDKRLRISGDLSLNDMQVDGRWQGTLKGLSELSSTGASTRPGVRPGVRTFTDEDISKTTDKELKALRQEMNSLQLYDKFEVKDLKLTKDRIYAMAFHPTEDKAIIFAGDKEGRLGIFDASQEPDVPVKEEDADDDEEVDAPEPVILGFKPHARTISSIYVLDNDPNSVYTASYDTTIRKLDIQAQKSVEVYAPPDDEQDSDMAISCMDFASDSPNLVFFSTLRGTLGRHDLRVPTSKGVNVIWPGLHDNHKIGGFSLSPRQPHLVATASLDRTLKIWDLRKIVSQKDDDGVKIDRPFLVGTDPARLSVSHAAWGPGAQIATTSYDDTVRVYDFAAQKWPVGRSLSEEEMKPAHKISHNNQTGRWVTILKPQWQRHPTDGVHKFVVGNMNRFVDVFAGATGEQLGQLDGDGITAVPAVAHFHPTKNWIAGGNASGKLTLWM